MQRYMNQINKLRELSGNAQLEFLSSIKSDMLKEILDYTYNPNKMYKIDEAKLALVSIREGLIKRKKKTELTLDDWSKFTEMLDKLVDKRSASLDDVKQLKYFITGFSGLDIPQFLSQIVAKDLRLNLGIKKIQTVWPDFCKNIQVQLAEDYNGKNFEVGMYSRKFDGKRMVIEKGIAKSRNGKPCKVAPIQHILDELKYVSSDFVYDGELLYFNKDGSEDFQKVISLANSDLRHPDCDNIYYVIFDIIMADDWEKQSSNIKFCQEYESLVDVFCGRESELSYSVLQTGYKHILIARQDYDDVKLQYERVNNNWEGLMYRNALAPYEFKRSKNLLKIKAMKDGEFRILGYGSGSGRNANRLGTLYIEFRGNKVGVGSGFSDEDRELIWNRKDIFLDNFNFGIEFEAKVQYFEETKDADGNDSLRFPVFLCFRDANTKEEFTVKQIVELYGGK